MARIKGGLNAKKKHNRTLKLAKGYRGARSKQYLSLIHIFAKDQGNVKIVGLAIANGLVSLAGSVFCQEERVFEISMGTGAIVIGLASEMCIRDMEKYLFQMTALFIIAGMLFPYDGR